MSRRRPADVELHSRWQLGNRDDNAQRQDGHSPSVRPGLDRLRRRRLGRHCVGRSVASEGSSASRGRRPSRRNPRDGLTDPHRGLEKPSSGPSPQSEDAHVAPRQTSARTTGEKASQNVPRSWSSWSRTWTPWAGLGVNNVPPGKEPSLPKVEDRPPRRSVAGTPTVGRRPTSDRRTRRSWSL